VKRHVVASTLLALTTAVALGACDGGSATSYAGSGPAGVGTTDSFCGSSNSCATCTPKNGCGWCYDSDGTGQCVSSPTECTTQAFDWTWNPEGCRVPAQAAIVPSEDAATGEDAAMGEDAGTGEDAGGTTDAGHIFTAGDASAPDGVAQSACLGPAPGDAGDGAAPCVVETP
jgi:hypothetical protein